MKANGKNKLRFMCLAVVYLGLVQTQATQAQVLEEVIVTANKKQESLSDVGMTVNVLSSGQMLRQGIDSMEDIAVATPSLVYARSASNTPIYALRGIGFNETSIGVYPAVSVYLDEAPLTFPIYGFHSAFDLDRVEVLKGPQGTLFGQNSTGGAVNFIAAKPTDELSGSLGGSFGSYDAIDLHGHISGPISENMNARLAFKTHKMDEWQESQTSGRENGKEKYTTARAMLDWQPDDRARVVINLNGWQDKTEPQATQLIGVIPKIPEFADPGLLSAPFPDDNEDADWTPGSNSSDRKMYQGTLRVEYEVNDNLLLTSLSSFVDFDQKQVSDTDGVPAVVFDFAKMDASAETFTQEIRLENVNVEKYRWVTGAYYESSEASEDQILIYSDNSTSNPNNLGIFNNTVEVRNEMENWAVFANLDYYLTEALKLKVGARYTDAEFENSSCNADVGDGANAALFNFLGNIFSGPGTFEPVGTGDCFSLNYQGQPGDQWIETLSEDNVSWRVGLDYHYSDTGLLYGNISQGYKQGSFPTLTAATWRAFEPVTQESVLAYEAGIKETLMNGRLSFSAAAFYYEYEDKQIKGNISDPVFGILEALRNIPEVEVYGAEFEVSLAPVEGLTLSLAATALEHEITQSSDESIDILGHFRNLEGDAVPYTADLTVRFNAEYRWSTGNIEPFIGLTYLYEDEKSTSIGGEDITISQAPTNKLIPGWNHPFLLDEINLLNVRAGFTSMDGKWTAFVWGRNVTDEYYWSNSTVNDDTIVRLAAKPRTYGLTVNYQF